MHPRRHALGGLNKLVVHETLVAGTHFMTGSCCMSAENINSPAIIGIKSIEVNRPC